MPRKGSVGRKASGFRQIQQQARALLGSLRRDIRSKETELNRLKAEAARLGALAGGSAVPAEALRGVGGGRINWRNVLAQVPRQFKASQVRAVRGLKSKRPSEIFAAITRWIDAGFVKRKSRGLYEKK